MTSSLRSSRSLAASRRPAGPRCHGGASSLLRLGFGALPQRVATARAWRDLAEDGGARIEHIVGMPARAPRSSSLS